MKYCTDMIFSHKCYSVQIRMELCKFIRSTEKAQRYKIYNIFSQIRIVLNISYYVHRYLEKKHWKKLKARTFTVCNVNQYSYTYSYKQIQKIFSNFYLLSITFPINFTNNLKINNRIAFILIAKFFIEYPWFAEIEPKIKT